MEGRDPETTSCTDILCLMQGPCSGVTGAKDFSFQIGSQNSSQTPMYFTIPKTAYLIDSQSIGIYPGFCILGITGYVPDNVNTYIFGSIFLQHYYAIFDQTNKKIGLAVDAVSDGNITSDPTLSFGVVLLSLVAILALMVVIAIIVICCLRRKNSREMQVAPYRESFRNNRNSDADTDINSSTANLMDFGRRDSNQTNDQRKDSEYKGINYSLNPDLDRSYSTVSLDH